MSDTPQERSDGEIPWQPPVIAAITGALLVGALVIFALVNGPVDDPESDALILRPVPSVDIPIGYTLTTSDGDVGIKVESMTSDGGSSTVTVSSAVRGTTEPADSPPPEGAYWEMEEEGEPTVMDMQLDSGGSVGSTTIVFPVLDAAEPIVAAYLPAVVVSESATMEVGPDALGEPIAFGLVFEPDTVISGELVVGDGWGTVEWSSPDGIVATLDVAVTLVGTDSPAADISGPIRLVPVHDSSLAEPDAVIVNRPLYGFGGTYGLYGDGRALAEGGQLRSILIELEGTVVTKTADAVVLTFDPTG